MGSSGKPCINSRRRALTWGSEKAQQVNRSLVEIESLHPLGAVLGAVLYPLELALVARLNEGPSTELMLCKPRLPDP